MKEITIDEIMALLLKFSKLLIDHSVDFSDQEVYIMMNSLTNSLGEKIKEMNGDR